MKFNLVLSFAHSKTRVAESCIMRNCCSGNYSSHHYIIPSLNLASNTLAHMNRKEILIRVVLQHQELITR